MTVVEDYPPSLTTIVFIKAAVTAFKRDPEIGLVGCITHPTVYTYALIACALSRETLEYTSRVYRW